MTRRLGAWLQFLSCVLLLSFLIWFRAITVELFLGWLTLAFIAVLSVLVLRAKWKHRHHLQGNGTQQSADAGDVMLRRIRNWWMDEKNSN
ncbi:MAG: hypothetical protein ACRD9S_18240 [Pyrinomonadaceae bacterium]